MAPPGHFGPFWAIWGVFWPFSGHLGLLDAILDQYAAAGATRIIVPPTVEILAFLASFRAILTGFWADFAPLGPFGPFLGPFGPFLGPFRAFWALFRPLLGPLVPL